MAAKTCIACNRDSAAVPIVKFEFQGTEYWICTQHLPVLIHNPAQLVQMLPGSDGLEPAVHP